MLLATVDLPGRLPQLGSLDLLVVAVYMAGVFGIAFWAWPRIKDCGSFLVGSRKMGKTMTAAASFGGGTNANHPIAVASAVFQNGMSGVWISLTYILITPFFWVFLPVVRRMRIVTLADAMRMRFGPTVAMVFKVVSIASFPVSMALGIKSAALIIEVMSGGTIGSVQAVALIAVPTLAYTLLGGIIAAYATDVFQGLLIVVLSFLLIPFAITRAGGLAALDAGIDDKLTSLFAGVGADFGFWWVFWFAVGITFSSVTAASSGAFASTDEKAARAGVYGTAIKRFCTVGWGLVGLCGIVLFAGHPLLDSASGVAGASPDNIFGVASASLLPTGLRGLMVASILAAVMSSLAAGILMFGGMTLNNVYQEHWVPRASPGHYLLMARVFSALGLGVAWWIAGSIGNIVDFSTIVESVGSLTGISLLIAIVWRRVTGLAALLSIVVATPLFLAVSSPAWPDWHWVTTLVGHKVSLFDLFHLRPLVDQLASLYSLDLTELGCINSAGEIVRLPVQIKFPLYLLPTVTVLVVTSLLTRQHNQHAVAEFYCRIDTPVGEEETIRAAGFQVDQLERLDQDAPEVNPANVGRRERLLLVDLLSAPRLLAQGRVQLADYRWDLIGIVGSILFAVLFLLGVEWLGTFF